MELSSRAEQGQGGTRLSKAGFQTAMVAMTLILPSLIGVFWLSIQIPRQYANRNSLRASGVNTTAKIDKVVTAKGSLWVKYTFEAEGRAITNEIKAPGTMEKFLYHAETIEIRYLPSNPEINHPVEWEWSPWSEVIWIAVFVWTIPGLILLNGVRKSRRHIAINNAIDRGFSP